MKRSLQLSWPTLVSVAATRGMMGVGAGILLAPKIDRKRRRAVGLALFGLGLAPAVRAGQPAAGKETSWL